MYPSGNRKKEIKEAWDRALASPSKSKQIRRPAARTKRRRERTLREVAA